MNAKQYLNDIRREYANAEALAGMAASYRHMAEGLSLCRDGVRVTTTPNPHRAEDFALRAADASKQAYKGYAASLARVRQAQERISRLEDADLRALLMLRYLCRATWEEISLRMHWSLRTVHRMHAKALNAFQTILDREGASL